MLKPLIVDTDDDGWVTLHLADCGSFSFELPNGFSGDIIGDVLLTAGLVKEHEGQLLTTTWASSRTLGQTVLSILSYFDAPGEPSAELQRIRAKLVDMTPDDEVAALPMLSVAWLDWMIGEEVADSARASDVWSSDQVTVNVAPIRERLLSEALDRARSVQPETTESGLRLAPSVRHRRYDRQSRTG